MDPCTMDECSGWAEFASFESEQPGSEHKLKNETLQQQEGSFANFDSEKNILIFDEKKPVEPVEFENSIAGLLQDCFRVSGNEKLSTEEICENNLELITEDSRLWQNFHTNEENTSQVIWKNSKLHENFMKSMNKFLTKEDANSSALLPEDLDLSLFIPCFNFHKFAKRKNNAKTSRPKEQVGINQNPASELNPFAPEKIQESDRCSSETSICDSASVSSFELLSVKEDMNAECSSTTSTESANCSSETNGKDGEIGNNDIKDSILEKWKKLQGMKNVHEVAKVEFSVSELKSLLDEHRQSCSRLSEELVKKLKEKDDLLREKRVRDDFISSLLAVSRKQKQKELSQTSKRKRILSHVLGHVETQEFKFLDTSIPYFPTENGPSLPDIIALTSIFQAILDEDPKVPGMVSNYILNALKRIQYNGGVS